MRKLISLLIIIVVGFLPAVLQAGRIIVPNADGASEISILYPDVQGKWVVAGTIPPTKNDKNGTPVEVRDNIPFVIGITKGGKTYYASFENSSTPPPWTRLQKSGEEGGWHIGLPTSLPPPPSRDVRDR